MNPNLQINRTQTPEIRNIGRFNIIEAVKSNLDNGIPVYAISNGDQDIIKIDFIFPAGNWHQSNPLVAFAVNNLISEGTQSRSAADIANILDLYGAITSFNVDKDNAIVGVLILRKYLNRILPVLFEILTEPAFSEKELSIFRNKHKQIFQIEQNKVKNIARVQLSQMIFGNNHPYGYIVELNDFDNLTSPVLFDFYKEYYQFANCHLLLSGKVHPEDINMVNRYFGKQSVVSRPFVEKNYIPSPHDIHNRFIEKPDAVQSAIRIGRELVNKTHADYIGLTILNVILGGYFGSRLMRNVREDKGYTYGINSLLISFIRSGYLTITTEVGSDVTRDAIREVYSELELLRNEPVPDEELSRVKNYMLGEMVRMFDGPFAQAESFMSILEYKLGYDYYYNFIDKIKSITSDEIFHLAQKYFQPEDFYQVVVGTSQE